MVYVDDMMTCIPNRNWRWNKACHLFADSVIELHAFAASIDMKRPWFRHKGGNSLPHYDLTANKRVQAVTMGAIELDRHQAFKKRQDIRGVRYKIPAAPEVTGQMQSTGHDIPDTGAQNDE